MRIQCSDDPSSSEYHVHYNWAEFQACVGPDADFRAWISRPKPAPPITTTPDATAARSEPMRADSGPVSAGYIGTKPDAKPTGRQLWRINKDGGSWRDAYLGNRAEASALIGALSNPALAKDFKIPGSKNLADDDWELFPQERAWRRGELGPEWMSFDEETGKLNGIMIAEPTFPPPDYHPVKAPEHHYDPEPAAKPATSDRYVTSDVKEARENVRKMLPLLDHVEIGYYAVRIDSGLHNDLKFFRLSRPNKGRYNGCIKLQWQLADRWEECWVLWPSGRMSWLVNTFDVPAYILGIMSDPTGACRLYAKMIDKCCRCNITLTDERSRHYGIGPECEKHRPDIIETVDLEDALRREEADAAWK